MAQGYHWVSPTDVDQFIELPDVFVDLSDKEAITIYYGDSIPTWDCISCKASDYAINCNIPMNMFFNLSQMNWTYAMQPVCNADRLIERETLSKITGISPCRHIDISPCGHIDIRPCGYIDISPCRHIDISPCGYIDISPVDAGPGGRYPIVDDKALSKYMYTASSIFIHYKQAASFFQNSFRVLEASNELGQMYAAYIDKDTGKALPHTVPAYMCTICETTMEKCKCQNYYRDSYTCHQNVCGNNHNDNEVRGNACRPDTSLNMINSRERNGYEHTDKQYALHYIAHVPFLSYAIISPAALPASINASGVTIENDEVFVDYTVDARRMLILYYLRDGKLFLAFRSHDQMPASDTGEAIFILDSGFPSMPRMCMPISMVFASEPYIDASGIWQISSPDYPIPFRYDIVNDPMRPMAERLIQLASVYLFDDCSQGTMMNSFPQLHNESKMLLDAVIAGISMHMSRSSEVRNLLIKRISETLGLDVFDTFATTSNGMAKVGKMKDILLQMETPLCITTAVTVKYEVLCDYPEQITFIIHRTPVMFRVLPTMIQDTVEHYSALY